MFVTLSVHPVGWLTEMGLVARKSSGALHAYQNVPMLAVLALEFDQRDRVVEIGAVGRRGDDPAGYDTGEEPA